MQRPDEDQTTAETESDPPQESLDALRDDVATLNEKMVDRSTGHRGMPLRLMFQGVEGGSKATSHAAIANTLQSLLP